MHWYGASDVLAKAAQRRIKMSAGYPDIKELLEAFAQLERRIALLEADAIQHEKDIATLQRQLYENPAVSRH